ncbi:DNA-binding beta-propeller fold protein YncE [Comamonas sp. BIGb0124]|nr:DNA-binding beta-propeller fold protein YncE [Comamonas sp. BIGb0124]
MQQTGSTLTPRSFFTLESTHMFPWKSSLSLLATAALLAACAQPGGTPAAGVSASQPGAVSAPAVAQQRRAVGQGLYELAYSPRQNAVFVASTGGFGADAAPARILRLDPATLAVQAEIQLPNRGFGVILDDAANRLYVGNSSEASITVVDTAANRVSHVITLAEKTVGADGKAKAPHSFRELVLDTARHRLYAPGMSMADSALYVVDTRSQKVEKVVPGLGQLATGVALDAAGNRLFVSNLKGEIAVVDTVGLIVNKTFDSGADQPLNLAFDGATNRLFATDQGLEQIQQRRQKSEPGYTPRAGNRVIVLDADSGKSLASLPTGAGPVALKLDAARQRLAVTNRGAGTVTLFDSRSYQLLQTVAAPAHPNSLAQDEARNVWYVTVKNGRDAEKGSLESVVRLAQP